MIDIHFHCLPGVDDGPRTWDESIELCRAAFADGSSAVVATPHVLRDPWLNERAEIRTDLVRELNERLNGEPLVLNGCEFFFAADAVELWERSTKSPLIGLNESNFLLVEFPSNAVPTAAESVVHELVMIGVTPVIAHPERNKVFAAAPERLERFVELGAITQLTAGSVLGLFGREAYAAADEFLRRGLANLIASDAHSVGRRPPVMSAARVAIRQRWGTRTEELLFEETPQSIVTTFTSESRPPRSS